MEIEYPLQMGMSDPFDQLLQWLQELNFPADRPRITLSYAQSLDGSIALENNAQLVLSNPISNRMTHHLRAHHDAILVGIGTILADDPQLTVRLSEGRDPQPIILDRQLRTPLESRIFQNERKPWIIAGREAPEIRRKMLEAAGATIHTLPTNEDVHIDLKALVGLLAKEGLRRLMVEGGAHIIRSFLEERIVDLIVLTIAPIFVNGLHSMGSGNTTFRSPFPRMDQPHWQMFDSDLVLWGELKYGDP